MSNNCEIIDERNEFTQNPEMRVPCALMLDISSSMGGAPERELNEGVQVLLQTVASDPLASRRVELGVVTFGGIVEILQGFATIDRLQIPYLKAEHAGTPMSEAILQTDELVAERKLVFQRNGVRTLKPWIVLLTDGAPTDLELWPEAVKRVREGDGTQFQFFAIGVGEHADLGRLRELTTRAARLKGFDFRECLKWVGKSMISCSKSISGQRVALPPPNWIEVTV